MPIVCIAMPPINGELDISRGINLGGFFPSILFRRLTCLNFFSLTSFKVCNEGVADPK